ncbi:MAG: intermembrane transport protein PqiB [Myxococcota bacterium]
MSEAEATVTQRARISKIWLVPLVAVVLGVWMVIYTWTNQGPEIEIVFVTADGIEARKTKIQMRSVEIGRVEKVEFSDDFEEVVVSAKLERSAVELLREDTQFWVVRARVGTEGISGLSTILSGGYIELSPGTGATGRREFAGLENPPITPAGTPGLELVLVSDRAGSVSSGNPILYKGFRVGRIEGGAFHVETQKMHYRVFIEEPYDDLVTTATRFWDMSGISFSASANGIEFDTGSLETLLLGGAAFGLPTGVEPGSPVEDGAVFELFSDRESIDETPYRHSFEYVVEFARSVRGLQPGAPVEYRGLRAGRVERLLLEELVSRGIGGQGSPIPVLIRLEPGRLMLEDSERGVEILTRAIVASVKNGMRATLSTGNLLTGSLYVSLDFYDDVEPAEIGTFAGRPSIPTIASGLEGIQQQIASLLDKLNDLPLEDVALSADATLRSADDALRQLEQTVVEINTLMASEELQTLPRSVQTSLSELDRTLRQMGELAETIEEQPNALIFPRSYDRDPEPPAGSP